MEGRGAGSKGLIRAQHLIEKRYQSLGLEPAGTSTYLQPFSVIIIGLSLSRIQHSISPSG